MPTKSKDTIYIDAEDEITAIIDKVVNAKHKIVALVLPKRASVFQSAVNMKLLKKAAAAAQKNLVLITSDKGILAMAAATSVHVAKSLTSKPEIPPVHSEVPVAGEHVDLSDGAAITDTQEADDQDDSIELDNTNGEPDKPATDTEKKKKLIKIPDFSSFRARIGLGIGALLLLFILWYIGFVVMPKATVTVNTDTSTTSISAVTTLKVGQAELDLENNIIPAERVQVEKIDSVTVPATGEKNIGNKATGILTLTNCIKDNEKKVIAAGTRFSKDSFTFETTEQIILEAAIYQGNTCRSDDFPGLGAQGNVDVAAIEPGPQFNVSGGSFNSSISGIQAYGSDMSGGSSEIIKVISEEDVQKAEQQLNGTSRNAALSEMQAQLSEDGKLPIDETLNNGEPKTTVVPAIGEEAEEVEVTVTVTYSLMGIEEQDLSALLDSEIQKKQGDEKKNIKDNGLDAATFQVTNRPNEAETLATVETVAILGPEIDEAQLREEIAGKKRGEIEKQIESIDGVRSVSVEYSPAWITTTPKSADKITIIFNEPDEQ